VVYVVSSVTACNWALDLQNDFNQIVAKRETDSLRLLPARLPLQKSVSTPSIIAAQDIRNEVAIDGATPIIPP
jgi:A-kinase anchor protein 13